MSVQVALRLSESQLAELDAAVAQGRFPNRTAALRAGLEVILREERERAIAEAYRRGYGAKPQEDWIGEAGAYAAGEVLGEMQDRPERDA